MSFLKDIFLGGLSFLGLPKNRAVILMYHSVDDNDVFFTVSSENFEKQLQYIKSKRFTTLKLSELVRRLKDRENISNCIALTFDDGYKDNYTNALGLLKKYDMPATIFLTTGDIETKSKMNETKNLLMLSESEIDEMYESNLVEFMPHTVSHPRLSKISDSAAENEMEQSRNYIEGRLSTEANIFAYPSGIFDDKHVEMLKKNDWIGAVTVKEGLVTPESDLFQLPRVSIDSSTTFLQFEGKLSSAVDIYEKIKKLGV
jgi:peptidoglycan/xylan/chitin deacetylase (PgdA/CDA1 family)